MTSPQHSVSTYGRGPPPSTVTPSRVAAAHGPEHRSACLWYDTRMPTIRLATFNVENLETPREPRGDESPELANQLRSRRELHALQVASLKEMFARMSADVVGVAGRQYRTGCYAQLPGPPGHT